MATLLHGESRRMYSWWWDSHISPKNSKWLQENLTDMDRNVKAMIKLIEEDADSFAKRAEMYYKKRPELMKLVEEFYRAYRALSERYDHATGALRQAHRTMAEAFPNQIPPIVSDESPSSSGTEFGPRTPEMSSPMRAPLDLDDLQKDVLGVPSNFHSIRRNGAYSEESKSLSSKKGLKQLKEMFPSGEGLTRAKSEGKVRKVLNFKEGKAEENEGLKNEIKRLQGEVSHLTMRNENLMTQMASESQHARTLEETISKLEAVKEAALLQYKLSIERMSSLETDICNTRDELNKVNNEMVVKLNSIEDQCLAMEKVNKSLQLELENQQKELEKRGTELDELNTLIEAEHQKRMQAEVALMSLEQIHTHSLEEAELLVLEIQRGSEKLKKMELNKVGLEGKISELNEIIGNLHEQNVSIDLKIKDLQDEMKLLKETKEELEHELGVYTEERKALQDELFCLKEDQRDLEQRNRGLTEEMEVVSEKNVVLENSLSDVNVELEGLREKAIALEASCETLLCKVSTHVVENGLLVSQIEIISQNMERLSEKSTSLENSLSDANAELEGLRARFKDMEECCMSLCDQNSTHLAEKNALVSQGENLEKKYLELQNGHLILEKEKDSKNLLEASRCAESQISQLKHTELMQKEELTSLSECNGVLTKGIQLFLEALSIDVNQRTAGDITEEVLVQIILVEIKNLLNSISDTRDENQQVYPQVETSRLSLEMLETEYTELEDKNMNLEIKYAELENKNMNLEREKDLFLHQILELENSLELEKQGHHALISSSKNQIASLATQLDLLQEERQVKEDEFEREQQKASDALLQNFILQSCLNDMKDRNLILSEDCQKLLDASRHSDKLISVVQHECLIQQKEMKLISENNEKLRNGILLMLKELNINMDCGTVDGTNDEVMLQTLLDQIKTMLNSVSNVQEDSQCLSLEISVLGTLLKEIGLEKIHLYYELGSQIEEVLSLQEKKDEAMGKNERLKAEMQILVEQLSDLQESHQTSQTEIHNLHEVNQSLSKRFYDLKEKMVALEEGNSDTLAEALTLDHLFIFFKAQNTERGLKLKLLSDNICSILAVKNGLDEENRAQDERIRKLEVQTMNLNESAILQEFDLNIARNFCEELNLQIEAAENLLLQKEMELSEAREENTELCRKLESVNKDLDGAIVMQRALKREINTLSLGIVSKEGKITEILEANRFLHKELDRLVFEVEVLRRRVEYLTSELQKGISEVNKCEGEIQTLLDDIQISTVNAAIFEEKLLEQVVACESLHTVSMLEREMLGEEIALKNACADELKKDLGNLEAANGTLKADLNAYSPLLMSLFDGVACVEELIFSLAKLQDKQVNDTSDAPESKKSSHQPIKNDSTSAKAGFLDLQKQIAKVDALQKVIIDSTNLIQQERLDSNAKIEAAWKEIEELKLKEMLLQEKSKEKYGQIMKDIQLDQVSRSRVSSYSANKNENGESDDQMLELWETAERDDVEAVEEVKSEYPSSELIGEKELSIDKLEVSTRINESSPRVWNKRFIEKLDSDAQRLSVLQRSLQELKTKLESTEETKHPETSEYGTLKAQLREAEEAILEQIDINGELKKKAEDNFESSNAVIWEKERRRVSEEARRGSEKIAKLELELQKIQYIFLKVEEEEENMRTGCVDRKSSTLRDYISGKRDGKGKRKGPFCGCMRPKTKA